MSIPTMLLWYVVIMAVAILMLCSKGVPSAVKWLAGFMIVGFTLALIIAVFIHFSVKAGFIRL